MIETPDEEELIARLAQHVSLREPIFVIESPSPDDLYVGRNEGDALVRLLGLANIDVNYYLTTDAERFDTAFEDISSVIAGIPEDNAAMPFIHISGQPPLPR